jgi:hypothetical protein
MGVAFADYDGDGWPDVFVANDNSPNLLFHNLGGKRFEEVGLQAGVAYNDEGNVVAGYGRRFPRCEQRWAAGHLAHRHRKRNVSAVPEHRAKGLRQRGQASGLANLTRPMSGWSNGMVDLDNDGWKDLVVARGNVMDNIEQISRHFRYAEPNSSFAISAMGSLKM